MPIGYQYGYANSVGYNNYPAAPSPIATGNPYLVTPAPVAASYSYAQPLHNGYSASQMIYGVAGSTYTAARPAPAPAASAYQPGNASDYGFAARPAAMTAANSCGLSYGVPRKC